jgi:glycine/D-amino acid oxidase-like deaminating enzyme
MDPVVNHVASLWLEDAGDLTPRPGLDGDREVDVCIVGAGYTGLWTAYYLLRADPTLSVLLLEAEIAGFGASGRNGGWCSALFPVAPGALVQRYGVDRARALRTAMIATVAEVGRVAAAEGIEAGHVRGGTVHLARSPAQVARLRAEIGADARLGGVDELSWLTAAEARENVGAAGVLGAMFTPHCARVQPARLVRGLARVVEALGGVIAEGTRVTAISPGPGPVAVTDRGRVRARHLIRATEAWTATMPGTRRRLIPVYSLMVATRPLPQRFWAEAGLARGQTFTDARHLVVYGQRTADDRLAFGGRGAPYHYGSTIRPGFDRSPAVFGALRATLRGLFPALRDDDVTHGWGGPLGVPRDWHASVGLDPGTGVGWAGGYVGDGVSTTNLAGRTLRDLVLGHDTDLTRLPWVGHRSPNWEPEPLRWLGVNAGRLAVTAADAEERLTGRPSVTARLLAPLLGH